MASEAISASANIKLTLPELDNAFILADDASALVGKTITFVVKAIRRNTTPSGFGIFFGELVEIPITNWQATIQNDRQSYAQITLPDTDETSEIISKNYYYIYQRVSDEDVTTDILLFSFQRQNITSYRGPTRRTVIVSGYFDYSGRRFRATDPPFNTDTDSTVQTVTVQDGKYRVRMNIDYRIRPSRTISYTYRSGRTYTYTTGTIIDLSYTSASFRVDYINYYVNNQGAFMEVGSR